MQDLYRDEELTQTLIDLIETAADLDILDFQVFFKKICTIWESIFVAFQI